MDFIYILFLLICFHFLFDYPLQGDFIAKFKARTVDGKPNEFWLHCLTAHSFMHALPILIVTGSVQLAAFMVISHWMIDFAKCENKISLNLDQFLHLIVITIISFLFFIG